jgi:hypothetical protein
VAVRTASCMPRRWHGCELKVGEGLVRDRAVHDGLRYEGAAHPGSIEGLDQSRATGHGHGARRGRGVNNVDLVPDERDRPDGHRRWAAPSRSSERSRRSTDPDRTPDRPCRQLAGPTAAALERQSNPPAADPATPIPPCSIRNPRRRPPPAGRTTARARRQRTRPAARRLARTARSSVIRASPPGAA